MLFVRAPNILPRPKALPLLPANLLAGQPHAGHFGPQPVTLIGSGLIVALPQWGQALALTETLPLQSGHSIMFDILYSITANVIVP